MNNKLSFFVYATLLATCLLKLLWESVPQKDQSPFMDVIDPIYVLASEDDFGSSRNAGTRT